MIEKFGTNKPLRGMDTATEKCKCSNKNVYAAPKIFMQQLECLIAVKKDVDLDKPYIYFYKYLICIF